MGRKKTTAEHECEVKNLGHVELLGEYKGANTKTLYRCLRHGKVHPGVPSRVLMGKGLKCCKEAADQRKRDQAAAKYDAAIAVFGKLERLEPYKNSLTPIAHRCLIHGEIHPVSPGNALNGKGTHCCWHAHVTKGGPKASSQEHAALVAEVGRVELVGEYKGYKSNAMYRCLEHGEKHLALPGNILKGQGLKCCLKASTDAANKRINERCAKTYKADLANIGKLAALEPYIDNETPILHRCLIHGKVGLCAPYNAKMGKGMRCCKVAASRKVGLASTNRFMPDSVWRVLTDQNDVVGETWLYLYKSPSKGLSKFGITKHLKHRAYTGGYGHALIEPRNYLDRAEAVLIEQAYKYGWSEKTWPVELDEWSGHSELTSQSPQEFIDTIEELEEALFKMGRWAFAEEFCDPAELERAKSEQQNG